VFSKRAAGETTLADGQAVKQDGDAALVTEPAVLSEARLVATAWRAAPDVEIPTLLAVAKEDAYIGLSEERALYRRLGSPQKRMIILPAGAGHGWTMLMGANGRWSRFERTLTAFFADHARAP
jgi:alpha-beta hydrolase superfamily lysophospholipase